MPMIKSVKRQTTEGIILTNQEKIRKFGEKENYKLLGILEYRHYQISRDERKNKKKVS